MSFNSKKLMSSTFFFLSPVVGLLVAAHGLKKNQINFFNVLVSTFIALVFLKNPPLDDLYRYMEMYDYLNTSVVFNELSNYSVFYFISYFFKLIGIPFYVMVSFLNFIIIYFALKSLHMISIYFDWSVRYYLLAMFGFIIVLNPLVLSLSLRAPLAMSLFTYGFVNLVLLRKRKACFYFILSVIFHFSFLYLVAAIFISGFLKVGGKFAALASVLFFLIANSFLPILITFIPFEQVNSQYSNYITNTAVGEGKEGFSALVVNVILFSIISFFMIGSLFLSVKKSSFDVLRIYRNKLLVLIMFVCLSAFQYLVFFRFSFSIILIEYIYILVYFNFFGGRILLIALICILSLNLIVVDVYIRKDSLILGSPITLAFLPPVHTLLYTDFEYRMFLDMIDKDGILK